jgi:methyl coenzyme M reductase subunit C-like uncharacterized protein (methanogenesis marker protein 7)
MNNKFEEFTRLKNEILEDLTKLVKSKKCICCDREITILMPEVNINPLKQDEGMWKDGVVTKLSCGFGSSHDMSQFYFGVCDDCITQKARSFHLESLDDIKQELNTKGYDSSLF